MYGSSLSSWSTSHRVKGFPNITVVCMKILPLNPQMVFISNEKLLGVFFSIHATNNIKYIEHLNVNL